MEGKMSERRLVKAVEALREDGDELMELRRAHTMRIDAAIAIAEDCVRKLYEQRNRFVQARNQETPDAPQTRFLPQGNQPEHSDRTPGGQARQAGDRDRVQQGRQVPEVLRKIAAS